MMIDKIINIMTTKKNNFINGLPLVDISVSVAMIESKSKPNVTFFKLKLKYYI